MSERLNYPSPCDKCKLKSCRGLECDPWRIRYLYRQKLINAYAKKHGITVGEQNETETNETKE